jgi:hypothetical protein
MRRRYLTDSSSSEYAPTDIETGHYSSSETKFTDVDKDVDKANLVTKFDESNDIEDADGVEEIDYADLPNDEVHPPKYYLKLIEEFNDSGFRTEDYSKSSTCLLD